MSNVTVWRICEKKYSSKADVLSGEGARLYGGRFNPPGVPVVYAASSVSLAILELLVQGHDLVSIRQFSLVPISFSKNLVYEPSETEFPEGWNAIPYKFASQKFGHEWILSDKSLALSVPSVVVPIENNYVINPLNSDIRKIAVGKPIPVPLDVRI